MLMFTGNGTETQVEILLPPGQNPGRTTLNGEEIKPAIKKVEDSVYACLLVSGLGVHTINVDLT